jgi:hypothetical protein
MKTVTLGNIEYALTPEKIRRIKDAMKETQGKINKQMGRPENMRDQNLLSQYEAHTRMLEGILKGAEEMANE